MAQKLAQQEQTLAVPLDDQTTPGEGSQGPFGRGSRFLAIYAPSEFLTAMPEGGFISQVAFRLDETVRFLLAPVDFPQFEVRMSTSQTLVSSPISHAQEFSANIGQDETVVFDRGPLRFSSRIFPSGANPFDLVVSFSSPFFYDPRRGSLAVDLLTFDGPSQGPLIDTGGIDDFGTTTIGLSGNLKMDLSGRFLDAPVMQLRFQAIPEPSMFSILVVGMLTFLLRGGNR